MFGRVCNCAWVRVKQYDNKEYIHKSSAVSPKWAEKEYLPFTSLTFSLLKNERSGPKTTLLQVPKQSILFLYEGQTSMRLKTPCLIY
jgi:hypothetical protein